MPEMLLSMGILFVVVAAMSIGVMMGRKPIKGSCGGLGAVGIRGDCEICGGNPDRCETPRNDDKTNDLAQEVRVWPDTSK